jgi:DNA-binding protein YbaB
MNVRWGFEEDDGWDEDERNEDHPVVEDNELLAGQDPDRILTVRVTDMAEVRSVALDRDWKNSVDPRGVHVNVLAAMNAATMQALAKQVEQTDMSGRSTVGFGAAPPGSEAGGSTADDTPITQEDAIRLVDAATADLERYLSQAISIAHAVISAESSGGHITVSGRQRQIRDVSIDTDWVARARRSEIESELLDVLTSFGAKSSFGELAQGPQSSAVTELVNLAADPQALVRRIARGRKS